MAKRRKPKVPLQPLLIVDDRNQSDEAWIPANYLPDKDLYGWSKSVLVCQFIPGDLRSTLIIASYDFHRGEWRNSISKVEYVTHWQPLPDYPKEYRND